MGKDKFWKALAIGIVILTISVNTVRCVNSCKNFTEISKSFASESFEYDEEKERQKNTLIERFGTTDAKVYILDTVSGCLLNIVQVSLIDLLLFLVLRAACKGLENSLQEFVKCEDIKIGFEDVIGLDEIKKDLFFIASKLKGSHEDYESFMPHGVLLEGPPGNGKTMLAKALAKEAGMNFIAVDSSKLVSSFVGITSMNIKQVFQMAKDSAPCIVFIDEIDAIGSSRVSRPSDTIDKEENRTLNTLLSILDGFEDLNGVFVLAATNMAENLDPALLRPGRFDKQLIINSPTQQSRIKLLQKVTQEVLDSSVDIEKFASKMKGFSCAEVVNVIDEARVIASKDGRLYITEDDIVDAMIQKSLKGFEKNEKQSDFDRQIAAYHEAGHAVIGQFVAEKKVEFISISPTTSGAGGYTSFANEDENNLKALGQIENEIVTLYAGRAAEEKYLGGEKNMTFGPIEDIKIATSLASQLVQIKTGVDYSQFGSTGEKEILHETASILQHAIEDATKQVDKYWDKISFIAKELLNRDKVDGNEFLDLVNNAGGFIDT